MDYLVSNYKISVSENSLLISVDKKLWLAPYFITSLSSLPIVLFYFFIENNNFLFKGGIAFWFIFVTICCCIYAVIKIRKWWNEQNLEITFFNQEKLVRFQKPNKTI